MSKLTSYALQFMLLSDWFTERQKEEESLFEGTAELATRQPDDKLTAFLETLKDDKIVLATLKELTQDRNLLKTTGIERLSACINQLSRELNALQHLNESEIYSEGLILLHYLETQKLHLLTIQK